MRYRGRFAPSPTGPLHFGSLVAAVGSFLDARAHGGEWWVRIENLDPPREVPGAATDILQTLERLGLCWDGEVVYQSWRLASYADAVERLRAAGLIYPCACSRREIADSAVVGVEGPVYPGTCRGGMPPGRDGRAWRVRTPDAAIGFVDRVVGERTMNLARDIGDFVVRRADGGYAYQLAVVVDDAAAGITDVVRGADLLGSTARQIYLSRALDLPLLRYAHLPVALTVGGEKLSKQTGAAALDPLAAGALLQRALTFLGQNPPPALANETPSAILEWGRAHWRIDRVPKSPAVFV